LSERLLNPTNVNLIMRAAIV